MTITTGTEAFESQLRRLLGAAYDDATVEALTGRVAKLVAGARSAGAPEQPGWVDQTDVMLITYADSLRGEGVTPLAALGGFLRRHVGDVIGNVHLLPFYPWTSDDGFSVVDYRAVDPVAGDWDDVERLAQDFGLMFDGVINHISRESAWFQGFLKGDPKYRDWFHVCDPALDYSKVTRPRALPLLTQIETSEGEKHVWTTFSDDQIDLNYASPDLLIEILDLLIWYGQKGARFIRLDAIGFLWKRLGTTCMHLPETHAIIQVMRLVLDEAVPGVMLITETNVPHADNISYFGDGTNEAHLVYQFPLPPLTLHSFQTENAGPLSDWAASLDPTTDQTTYFNFLASHDGIGVRPVEGLLSRDEVAEMARRVEASGGKVSMRNLPDGGTAPYELNISYVDAVSLPEDDDAVRAAKILAAQAILYSVVGVPGVYIHSLLGSRNDYAGLEATGRNRSINREKLDVAAVEAALADPESLRSRVLAGHRRLLSVRRTRPAFHPNASQTVIEIDPRVFSVLRAGGADRVWALINVSGKVVEAAANRASLGFDAGGTPVDLIGGLDVRSAGETLALTLPPYAVAWVA